MEALSTTRMELGRGHSFIRGRSPATNWQNISLVMVFSTTSRCRTPSRDNAGRMEYLVPRRKNPNQDTHSPCCNHPQGLLKVSQLKWLSSANTSCSGRKYVLMSVLNSSRSCWFCSSAGHVTYKYRVVGTDNKK